MQLVKNIYWHGITLVLSDPVQCGTSARTARENITKDEDSSYWHPVTVPWFNINCTKRSPLIGKYEIFSDRGRVPIRAAQARARGVAFVVSLSPGGCKTLYMYIPYIRHVPKRKCSWIRSAGYLGLWELGRSVRLLLCWAYRLNSFRVRISAAWLPRPVGRVISCEKKVFGKSSARQSIKRRVPRLEIRKKKKGKTIMKMERNTSLEKFHSVCLSSAGNILLAGALWSFITFLQAITLAGRWRCFGAILFPLLTIVLRYRLETAARSSRGERNEVFRTKKKILFLFVAKLIRVLSRDRAEFIRP